MQVLASLSLAELDAYDQRPREYGSERRYLCLFCGDGKPRNDAHRCLCANTTSGAWKCQRCDARGKLRDFWDNPDTQPADAKRTAYNPRTARAMARQRRARLSEIEAPPIEDSGEWRKYLQSSGPLAQSRAAKYLQGRGISLEVATAAGAQFHPNFFGAGAAMFVIRDQSGQPVALNGRYIGNATPKTRTVGPKSGGAFMAPISRDGRTVGPLDSDAPAIIITEAAIDALSLAMAGCPALAFIGTSGPRWLHIACGLRRVVLAFDADEAGDKAAAKIAALLQPYGARCERLRPDGAKDWNAMLQVLGSDGLADWLASRLGLDTTRRPSAERLRLANEIGGILQVLSRAKRLKNGDWRIDGELYDHDNAVLLAAHTRGTTTNGYPLEFAASQQLPNPTE